MEDVVAGIGSSGTGGGETRHSPRRPPRVLLTGADGYIGSVAGHYLMERGFDVFGLDTGFFRGSPFYRVPESRMPDATTCDVRSVDADFLSGFEAVVHLAELSNDPLGQLNPEVTYEINHRGSVGLARAAKKAGVRRFVYASSCSVYGAGFEDVKTELSEPLPQTTYAECKVRVESDVAKLTDEEFSPTFLRNSTVYGPSPRMRFDLVVNNLAGHAWTSGTIRMTSDGSPWRPLVHIRDVCEAIACVLEAPRERVHGEVFNVGASSENYRIRQVAEIVSEVLPECDLTIGASDGDNRSYRVSFQKIQEALPGFRCRHDLRSGVEELARVFERVGLDEKMFRSPLYTRLAQLRQLLESGQVSERLFWRYGAEQSVAGTPGSEAMSASELREPSSGRSSRLPALERGAGR